MKRVCIFLFVLLLLFTGCQSKTETDGGKNNAINDPITDPDATETTEEGKTDSENGDPDGDSTEEELPGYSDIQTVDVGALGIHNLVFEGCALETSLPTKWQFEQLFDAMHPKLVRLYYPAEAVIRTLREEGFLGTLKKIARQLGKGGAQ